MSQPGWQQQPQQQQPWPPPPQPYGQPPSGPPPTAPPGQPPYGQAPQGLPPYGQPPYGQPSQGFPPPGYGVAPKPRGPLAVVAALAIAPVALLTLLFAALALFDALEGGVLAHALSGMLFMQFISDPDGIDRVLQWNVVVPLLALGFAGAMFARVSFARWVLVGIGGVAAAYFVFAIIKMLGNGAGGEYVVMPVLALLLWAAPAVLAALPAAAEPARGPQPPAPMGPQTGPPPGYWQ